MNSMTEAVANRETIVSSDTDSRRASPFRRGARSESAERVRSEKTAASLGYREICEEVISPLMAGLTERLGTVEARMDTQESAGRQEIAGLKAEIEILRNEIASIKKVADSALHKVENHTHSTSVHMKDSAGKLYVFNGNLISGSIDGATPVVRSLTQTGTRESHNWFTQGGRTTYIPTTVPSYDYQPPGLHFETGRPKFH